MAGDCWTVTWKTDGGIISGGLQMGTIIVLAALILFVGLAIGSMVRDKKKGKSLQCGGNCNHCGGLCHRQGYNQQHDEETGGGSI